MSRPPPSLSQRVRWRLEWLGYLAFEKTVSLLSPGVASRLGAVLGSLAGRVSARRRKTVERNLRLAFGREKSPAELARLSDEVFRRSGANLVASLCTAGMTQERLDEVVSVANPEVRDELIATGTKGVIILLAHMGNWEVLAQAFPKLIHPEARGGTIYRLLNNPYMDEHVKAVRRRDGLELFEKRSSPLAMASFIRHGGALGILSDQRAEVAGEIVPFFGRLTSCTPMPAILSRRLGAPVIGVSMRTVKPGRWVLKLHPLRTKPTTTACMQLLEEMIRESPTDVFWLQDRWRVQRNEPLNLNGRPPTAEALARRTQWRRVVVWVVDADTAPQLPAANCDDIQWEYALPTLPPGKLPAWLPSQARVHARSERVLSREGAMYELTRIDASDVYPVDVVVMPHQIKPLAQACAKLGLRTVIAAQQP